LVNVEESAHGHQKKDQLKSKVNLKAGGQEADHGKARHQVRGVDRQGHGSKAGGNQANRKQAGAQGGHSRDEQAGSSVRAQARSHAEGRAQD
jgi:hypothetical protein